LRSVSPRSRNSTESVGFRERALILAPLLLLLCGSCATVEKEDPEPPFPAFWMDPLTGCHYWRMSGLPRYFIDRDGKVSIYCTDEDGAQIVPGKKLLPKSLPNAKKVKTASYEAVAWVRFAEPVAGATVRVKL